MNCKNCLRYAQALALGLATLAVAATPSFAQSLVALEATATMPDGTVVTVWRADAARRDLPTVLYLQGNGGNISTRAPRFRSSTTTRSRSTASWTG